MRLIDADALYDCMLDNFCGIELIALKDVLEIINITPTVDAVVLPCKAGTPVFAIVTHCQDCVDSGLDDCNDYDDNTCMYESKYAIIETVFLMRMVDSFGKTVFLTRTEAEKALAEMEGK